MINYKIYITPLYKEGAYASQIDVTEYARLNGLSKIIEESDSKDLDIGLFTSSGFKMTMINLDERFSDSNAPNSIFPYKRDLAKVDVYFYDNGVLTGQFNGFISDTFSKEDYKNSRVSLSVIDKSGIFGGLKVNGGSVGENATVTEALSSLLDRPSVTDYLNFDIANINPVLDIRIDAGSAFDNLSYRDAINKLMLISGSIMLIDSNDNIIVRSRTENDNTIHRFYNSGDPKGRVNILRLDGYNTGVQRAFNSIEIDKVVSTNDRLVAEYTLRKKTLDIKDFITNEDTRKIIADFYLNQFQIPKQEFIIEVQALEAIDVNLFDLVSVDFKPIYKPVEGTLPIYGVAQYGVAKYPITLNKVSISDKIGFKVIAKEIDVINQVTTLKLREIGNKAGGNMIVDILVDEFGNYLIDENYNFLSA
jgi:hypothetical protein